MKHDKIRDLGIALAQLNLVSPNYNKINYEYQYAVKRKIDLLILPDSTFSNKQDIEAFAAKTASQRTATIAGGRGKILVIYQGTTQEKEFAQQHRYISAEINNLRLLILADILQTEICGAERKYDFVISLQNIPHIKASSAVKLKAAQEISRKLKTPLIHLNKLDIQEELIFGGHSFIISGAGKLVADISEWQEKTINTKWQYQENKYELISEVSLSKPYSKEESVYQALMMGLRSYAKKHGFKSAVLGLSGGIDSALTLAVAADAIGKDRVYAVLMPSLYTKESSIQDAKKYAENLEIEHSIVPIDKIFSSTKESLGSIFADMPEDITEENMQARIRGMILMSISNKFGHLMLCTGNKSEIAVGYCTLYGDTCGGYAPIADLYKTEVYKLSNWRNQNVPFSGLINQTDIIPESIISRAPSAELKPNQQDQDDLPPYSELDKILQSLIEEQKAPDKLPNYDKITVAKIVSLWEKAAFKRHQLPPTIKIPKILMSKK
ncbi:NAD+ synthase [Rickettsiales bacterium]|nr:NAD+ synthase [Rickettsiales bacterium]